MAVVGAVAVLDPPGVWVEDSLVLSVLLVAGELLAVLCVFVLSSVVLAGELLALPVVPVFVWLPPSVPVLA